MNYPDDFIDKIILGDCLEVMKDIPDKSIDTILCDLPYGTTACKWDVIIPFESLWEQYKRIVKIDSAIVLTATQPFGSLLVSSNLSMFRYRWVWNKITGANFQLAKLQPMNVVEDVFVFSHAKAANGALVKTRYNPIKTVRESPTKSGGKPSSTLLNKHSMVALHNVYTDKYPTNILTFEKPTSKDRVHPTQKPAALFEYLIKTYTNEGDLVLDNCIGSGTTAVAAINTKRHFIGIELNEEYHKIAQQRVADIKPKEVIGAWW